MKKNNSKKQPEPVAYDLEYFDYESIQVQSEYASDSEISDVQSNISEQVEDNDLKNIEELNNAYSFIVPNRKEKKVAKKNNDKPELEYEDYI